MNQQEFEAAQAELRAWEKERDAKIEAAWAAGDEREYSRLLMGYANARARKGHSLGI